MHTHYDTLEVTRTASPAVIRAAYRGLSQQLHPDKNPGRETQAEEAMKAVNQAFTVLSDPRRRQDYDDWLARSESAAQADVSAPSPNGGATPPEARPTFDLLVYCNKRKVMWMTLGGAGFVAIGLLLIWMKFPLAMALHPHGIVAVLAGIFAIVFFGSIGLYSLLLLINPAPIIVANEHGLQINAPGGASLRWSEIDSLMVTYVGSEVLFIGLADPDTVLRRQSLFGRTCVRINARYFTSTPAIMVSQDLVDTPMKDILADIDARMKQHSASRPPSAPPAESALNSARADREIGHGASQRHLD